MGNFEADAELGVRRAGVPVPLEPKPLRLFLDLLAHAPAVRTSEALREVLWPGETVTGGSLPRAVNALRRALGEEGRGWVETIRGRGYRMAAAVERIEPSADPQVGWCDLFVGRSEILSRLESRLAEAETGAGSVALVVGEAGIGKTRTAEILAERARGRGVRVYWGRCTESRGGPAYLPWFEILRAQLREQGGRDPFAGRRRKLVQFLAILMPELRDRLPSVGPPLRVSAEDARHGLFDSVTEILRDAGQQTPLLLVLDDLQWADEPSLRLLGFLARRIGELRVLAVATVRGKTLGEGSLATLTALPHVGQALRLKGLSKEEVGRLVHGVLGDQATQEVVASFHERTGGNPFFVRELTQDLASRGSEAGAPATAYRSITARVGELGEVERRVLEVCAVLGRRASIGLVSRVTGMSPVEVLDAAPELIRRGLVEELPRDVPELRFRHDIVREAVYAMLRPSVRVAAHAAVAATLEGQGDRVPAAEVAHHFAEAAPKLGVAPAIAHLTRAGREALERLAGEEAVRLFERGLALLDLEPGPWQTERCELLLGIGEAREALGAQVEARFHFAEAAALARDLEAPELFVRAVLGCTRHVPGHVAIGVHEPEAVALLEEALTRLGAADPSLRLEVMATLIPKLYWAGPSGPERADALGRRALAESRSGVTTPLRALCLCRRHLALWSAAGLEERLALAQEAVGLIDSDRDPTLALEARFLRIVDLLEFGEPARAFADVAEYQRLAETIQHPHLQAQAQVFHVTRALGEGRLDDAEAGLGTAEGLSREGRAPGSAISLGYQRLLLGWLRGDVRELDPRFDDLAAATPGIPGMAALVAWLAAELGDLTRARWHLEAVVLAAPRLDTVFDSLFVGAAGALACRVLDAETTAAQLYAGLLRYASRHVVAGLGILWFGSVSRYLGILAGELGRYEEAERHFEEARSANWRAGARVWVAETLSDHAALLLRRDAAGDRSAARHLTEEAASLAEALGLGQLARRVAQQRRECEGVVLLRRPAPRRR